MSALILPTLLIALVFYGVVKSVTRVHPNIPYAGDNSLLSRFKVPVQYGTDPVGFLVKQRSKLGDVFCVDLFIIKIIYFLGSEGNKIVFRAKEDHLSFEALVRRSMGPRINAGLEFQGWVTKSQLYSRLGFIKRERIDDYSNATAHLTDEYFAKWSQKKSLPLFQSLSDLILAHMFVITAGEDFFRKHGNELIPIMRQFEVDLQHPLLQILPWRIWNLSGPGRRILKSHDRFDELIGAECRDILADPDKHRGRTDYLYFLCENEPGFISVFGGHIIGMIFGAHANLAMAIPWLYLHARRTPGVFERLREEALLGPDEKKLFTEACLRETGRLYTNMSVLRMTKSSVTVAGNKFPSGTIVGCSPAASQRDPAVFKDPTAWQPERFLVDGAYADWFQKAQFVQFGFGQHPCPGEKLARLILFEHVVKTWMQKYDIEVVGGLQEGVKGVDGVGAEAAWTEQNFGTPSVRGQDVQVRVTKRIASGQ